VPPRKLIKALPDATAIISIQGKQWLTILLDTFGSEDNSGWQEPQKVSSPSSCSKKGQPWAQTMLPGTFSSWVLKTCKVVLWLSICSTQASLVGEQPNPWRAQVGEWQGHGLGYISCRRELPVHPRQAMGCFFFSSVLSCMLGSLGSPMEKEWVEERWHLWRMLQTPKLPSSNLSLIATNTLVYMGPGQTEQCSGVWTQGNNILSALPILNASGKENWRPYHTTDWQENLWIETNHKRNKDPSINTWLQHFSSIDWRIL